VRECVCVREKERECVCGCIALVGGSESYSFMAAGSVLHVKVGAFITQKT